MNLRDLIDEMRETVVADAELNTTRVVAYTTKVDNVETQLNSYIGLGKFNEEESQTLSDRQSFGGLKLTADPKVGDAVEHDGQVYFVQRYTKHGTLYTVYAEKARHKGRG